MGGCAIGHNRSRTLSQLLLSKSVPWTASQTNIPTRRGDSDDREDCPRLRSAFSASCMHSGAQLVRVSITKHGSEERKPTQAPEKIKMVSDRRSKQIYKVEVDS